MVKQILLVIAFGGIFFLMQSMFSSCVQEENFSTAAVETNLVTSVSEATAIAGGNVLSDNGSKIFVRGVCWSISPYPTIENDTTSEIGGTGSFTSLIKGLSPGTIYYVRAYAKNKGGISYGLQVEFTTKTFSISTTPIAISSITATSAIGGGSIISDCDSSSLTVIDRGVCWSTFPTPTIDNNKTTDGVGGGSFTSNINSLAASTRYYVRAYATNSYGTIYGNEINFYTQSGIIELTDVLTVITAHTSTASVTISSDGGASVFERGLCWSTSLEPTIANSKGMSGSGIGTFIANVTGLAPGTTYHVRAYAINIVGTYYGNEITFTTTKSVTDIDGNLYTTVKIGNQEWMVENLRTTKYNDGTTIPLFNVATTKSQPSTPSYCFYNNDAVNQSTYGVLYNWYTINTGKLAPVGWHIPADTEWTTLTNYLTNNDFGYEGSGSDIAKSMASTTGWATSANEGNIGNDLTSNNGSAFSGLPGGFLNYYDGSFISIGYAAYWWTSTSTNANAASGRFLEYYYSYVRNFSYYKQYGLSVRCIRDN